MLLKILYFLQEIEEHHPNFIQVLWNKSNTIGISQSRAVGSFSSSNRFLFRGNEEFHNTVGTKNQIKNTQDEMMQPLFVGSSNKPKKKKN